MEYIEDKLAEAQYDGGAWNRDGATDVGATDDGPGGGSRGGSLAGDV